MLRPYMVRWLILDMPGLNGGEVPYNPDLHHRRSIRLPGYDYSGDGAYFVTMCVYQRECLFGDVVDGTVRLNDLGLVVRQCWGAISDHFSQVELDEFVVMPNHVHGIVVLNSDRAPVGAQHAAPGLMDTGLRGRAQHATPLRNVVPGSLGAIIRSFKSAVTKRINEFRGNRGAQVWQRNYHEHVIRDENDLAAIRQYIVENPMKWIEDENYPARPDGSNIMIGNENQFP